MYTPDNLPKPLPPAEFYALLALADGTSHAYGIKDQIWNLSRGSVILDTPNTYRLIQKLESKVLIELDEYKPSGPSGTPRRHYAITEYGKIHLKEECQRLDYAVTVAKNLHLLDAETVPFDVQRVMLNYKRDSEADS